MPFFYSIIIPAFNASSTILLSIDSILEQSFTDYELIIVDDGSTDNTEKLVRDKYNGKVKYIYQQNQGVCSARNEGAKIATGQFLIFLDSDDWLSPNCLQAYYHHIKEGDVKLVLGLITFFNKKNERIREVLPVLNDTDYTHGLPGSFALQHEVFRELKGYDVNLTYSENSDLFLRIKLEHKIMVRDVRTELKEGVCKFVEHTKDRSSRYSRKKYESAKYFLNKHRSFFDTAPTHYINFKRIEALGAFQNGEFSEARRIVIELIKKSPLSITSYFHYFLFCFPPLAKLYYNVRL